MRCRHSENQAHSTQRRRKNKIKKINVQCSCNDELKFGFSYTCEVNFKQNEWKLQQLRHTVAKHDAAATRAIRADKEPGQHNAFRHFSFYAQARRMWLYTKIYTFSACKSVKIESLSIAHNIYSLTRVRHASTPDNRATHELKRLAKKRSPLRLGEHSTE